MSGEPDLYEELMFPSWGPASLRRRPCGSTGPGKGGGEAQCSVTTLVENSGGQGLGQCSARGGDSEAQSLRVLLREKWR